MMKTAARKSFRRRPAAGRPARLTAQAALRASEQRYRSLFEDSPIALWEEDFSAVRQRLDGLRRSGVTDFKAYFHEHPQAAAELAAQIRVIDVNNASLLLFQASQKSELRTNLARFLPPGPNRSFERQLLQVAAGNVCFEVQSACRTVLGEDLELNLTWAAEPGHEEDLARVMVAMVDITERNKVNAEMAKRAARLALINNISQKITGVLDIQGVLELAARLVNEAFGYYRVALFTLDDPRGELALRASAGEGADLFPSGARIRLGDGMVGYVGQTGSLMLSNYLSSEPRAPIRFPGERSAAELAMPIKAGGQVIGVLDVQSPQTDAFGEDDVKTLETLADQLAVALENARLYQAIQTELDERRAIEAELRDHRQRLEDLVNARTAELLEAKDQADAANRAKSDFLALMSHEIRTPLTGILGLTHLALQTRLTDKQLDYLSRIQFSGRTLLATINDILDFSKIEAGKLDLENVEFALDDVLHDSSSLLAAQAQEKGLELVLNTAPGVPHRLLGDPLRLDQVLLNLISNAVKFTETGSVVIFTRLLERQAGRVTLEFSVQDTGIGMSQAQMQQLFHPFIQAEASTTRRFGGTGLGLTISRRLVKLMGGEIHVLSQEGAGSSFVFSASFGWQPEFDQPPAAPPPDLAGRRALVVESQPAALDFLQKTLAGFGFQAFAAHSADSALAFLESASAPLVDLLLIDAKLPGSLDGASVARRIRQQPRLAGTPLLLLTGAGIQPAHLAQAGADILLPKPATRTGLLEAIQQIYGCQPQPASAPAGGYPQFPGQCVLLVEDNEINQVVAVEILQAMGLEVRVANHGEEALAMLDGDIRCILMDIQMPVMDGYQATTRIRRDPRHSPDKLPIIAMTAHALTGDREKVLAAGFNDYLAKPVEVPELAAALARWLPPAGAAAAPATPPAPGLPPEVLAAFDTPAALGRMGNKTGLYRRLLAKFHEDQAAAAEQIETALAAGDLPLARRQAHTLKGVAGILGANALLESSAHLEAALAAADPGLAAARLADLRPVLEAALAAAASLDA